MHYNAVQNKNSKQKQKPHHRFHFQEKLLPKQVIICTLTRLRHPSHPLPIHQLIVIPSYSAPHPCPFVCPKWKRGGRGRLTIGGSVGWECATPGIFSSEAIEVKKMKNELRSLEILHRHLGMRYRHFVSKKKKKHKQIYRISNVALPTRTLGTLYKGARSFTRAALSAPCKWKKITELEPLGIDICLVTDWGGNFYFLVFGGKMESRQADELGSLIFPALHYRNLLTRSAS